MNDKEYRFFHPNYVPSMENTEKASSKDAGKEHDDAMMSLEKALDEAEKKDYETEEKESFTRQEDKKKGNDPSPDGFKIPRYVRCDMGLSQQMNTPNSDLYKMIASHPFIVRRTPFDELFSSRYPGTGSGVLYIANERYRQILEKGYDAANDDKQTDGKMAFAAITYAMPENCRKELADVFWPWDKKDFHPSHDQLKNLIKAGALIAAEIDRRLRQRARRDR